jgi:hypothetical protein
MPVVQLSPCCSQQRRENVTPGRHCRVPQHSTSLVQLAARSPHIVVGLQSDEYQRHVAHEPLDGPVDVPVRHVLSVAQKPQALMAVHPLHVVALAQGSVMVVVVHVPLEHVRPEQQSADVVQL